MTSKVLKKS